MNCEASIDSNFDSHLLKAVDYQNAGMSASFIANIHGNMIHTNLLQ
jgi:hypothetical protein